jgi:hypothetical protein
MIRRRMDLRAGAASISSGFLVAAAIQRGPDGIYACVVMPRDVVQVRTIHNRGEGHPSSRASRDDAPAMHRRVATPR